jgi:hypothetical protein
MERTIVNQCGTEMYLMYYEEHGKYFTGMLGSQPIIGIELFKGEPHTLNFSHGGATEALERLIDGDLSQYVADCESCAKSNS